MTENLELTKDWKNWDEVVHRRIMPLMKQEDYSGALAEVEVFLLRKSTPEIRKEALGLRAILKQKLGDLEGAEIDLHNTRSLVGASYERYGTELGLASICEQQERIDEAIEWYRTALQTCVESEGISGGTALKKFLLLRGRENLTKEEWALCVEVVKRSWEVLGLPGRPDLTDLTSVVSRIKEGEANPPRRPRDA